MQKITTKPIAVWLIVSLSIFSADLIAQDWARLLMSKEQRMLIEQQRQLYFKLSQEDKNGSPAESFEKSRTLRVSAIIHLAQGESVAQINGLMFKQGEHKSGIYVHHINGQSVTLTVNGNRGEAYLNFEYRQADWPKQPSRKIIVTR